MPVPLSARTPGLFLRQRRLQTEDFQSTTANVHHAQPYAHAPGFYFTSYDDYQQKAARQPHLEEYELQFIDGPTDDAQLFARFDLASLHR
ncbi:hypothetical protein NDK50_34880 [Paraburkholderia bryophila]|uniref:hypothetical protein n=1 Tax=Paraburkholderia bryophila TaxID=420952 RepID=UPI0023497A94|nr:hypothetical protein [Paraburkholderia bryophila]WCM23137.1 hypothetical protein NDK50_34880 [Paraburkholderia bryophila]